MSKPAVVPPEKQRPLGRNLSGSPRRVRILGSIGLLLLGIVCLNPAVGRRLAYASYDALFVCRPAMLQVRPSEAIVVRMDDHAREELGQRREYVWDRQLHRQLIDSLAAAGTRAVLMDLFFGDPTPDDPALGEAIARHGRVVLGAQYTESWPDHGPSVQRFEPPVPALTNGAQVGLLNVLPDRDGVVRRLLPGRVRRDGLGLPTLSWAGAQLIATNPLPLLHAPVANLWLNYYGPPHESLDSIDYEDALKPEAADRLRGRIAVVGANFELDFPGTRKDAFPTPWGAQAFEIAGVELHATALLNLLRHEWLERLPAWLELLLVTGAAIALGLVLPRLRPATACATALGFGGALALASLALGWFGRVWWPWLIVAAVQIPAGLLWAWAGHVLIVGHEKDLLRRSLATYLSPSLVEEIVARPDSLRLGGEQRQLAILFTDIADFSRISERMDAGDLVALLNEYYEAAIACVHETGGTVLGILGDGMLAVWNAPVEQADPERRALRTARLLVERLRAFEWRPGAPPLRTRIALHSGRACIGNFGSPERFVYTAIGDAVNLTSRLEGLNKHLGTDVLATRQFERALGGQAVGRYLGFFRFKGFDQVLEVHEVATDAPTRPPAETPSADDLTVFSDGLQRFLLGDFSAAAAAFDRALSLHPEDGPARFYAGRCRELAERQATFDGPPVIELSSK